jgi:hypothetical protein
MFALVFVLTWTPWSFAAHYSYQLPSTKTK